MMVAGMKNGEMRRGPFSSRILCSRSITSNPPMPLPIYTPVRSASSSFELSARRFGARIRRRDGELDEPPHFLDFFFLDVLGGVEVLDLTGDAAVEAGGIEGVIGRCRFWPAPMACPDLFRAGSQPKPACRLQ